MKSEDHINFLSELLYEVNQLLTLVKNYCDEVLEPDDLNPILRGWINYFIHAETKGFAEELDQWIRRRLRLILRRQWKRPWTRFKKLMQLGISEERAAISAFNDRGPWFNSGAPHMNQAVRKKHFDNAGLFSLLEQLHQCRTKLT
jgi:RNA-directed DNA polymerase